MRADRRSSGRLPTPPADQRPGARWSGLLDVLPGEAPAVPCHVVQGADPDGPTLVVTAGVHGAEYASIVAAQRLAATPPDRIRGRLVVVPIVSTASYFARSIYVSPLDGKNLNRVFPGDPDGSPTERLAHWLVEALLAGADAYLDLHGGDLVEALTPFAIHVRADEAATAMAEAFGLPYRIEEEPRGSMSFVAAHGRGVPAVLAEAGGQGLWPRRAVATLEEGARRVLHHLGMTDAAPAGGVRSRVIGRFAWSRSEHDGCWYPEVEAGDAVRAGQLLGTLRGVLGEPLQDARSTDDGTVLFAVTSLAINAGDPLVGVGVPA